MKRYNYAYLVRPVMDEGSIVYQAIIPQFPKLMVFADSVKELDEAVMLSIEEDIKDRNKDGTKIPQEDMESNFSGEYPLRMGSKLHEEWSYNAQANKMSLNKYLIQKLVEVGA